uniref:Uncharacterized protein n=1 Tax=Strigamia maritima TaxID=126957 RepID=T1JFY8_STRMM
MFKSPGLSLRVQRGREFTAAEISNSKVDNCSNVRAARPMVLFNRSFTERTIRSQKPPHQAARSTICFQVTRRARRKLWASVVVRSPQSGRSSFWHRRKVLALSV